MDAAGSFGVRRDRCIDELDAGGRVDRVDAAGTALLAEAGGLGGSADVVCRVNLGGTGGAGVLSGSAPGVTAMGATGRGMTNVALAAPGCVSKGSAGARGLDVWLPRGGRLITPVGVFASRIL